METKYQDIFFQEAEQKLIDLNVALLAFEKNQSDEMAVNEAMRAAHTLKSSAAAMGYEAISQTAHEMEDLFEMVRTENRVLSADAVEVLFAGADALQFSIGLLKKGDGPDSSDGLLKRIHTRVKSITEGKDKRDQKKMHVQTEARGDMPAETTATIQESTTGQAEELIPEPTLQSTEDSLQSNQEVEYEDASVSKILSEKIQPIESIKVNIKTLDQLMNLTEELLVENMRLAEIVRVKKENPNNPLPLDVLENSKDSFNRLVTDLQYHVTQARMLPLGQVLERFPRLVRDLSKKMNKSIDFSMTGQDIELDRTVIDRLGEPLIHLIRNAVDHGITGNGKILLHASRMKDTVVIDIENSGDAIDWHRIVHSAVERNVLLQEKANEYLQMLDAKMDELSHELLLRMNRQLKHLLFHPQLSTKTEITETSGRGVGLHIVKTVIESFGGTVAVESPIDDTGEGTRFTLRLPLTLAIIQAMLVRVGHQTFAVPFTQIDRTVRITSDQIKKAFDQEIAVVDEEDVPLIRLRERFGIVDVKIESDREQKVVELVTEDLEVDLENMDARIRRPSVTNSASIRVSQSELMLITKPGALPIAGLIVDELIAEQDIVVKPLKGVLQSTSGFAGITLLGDGKPALILDVGTLI